MGEEVGIQGEERRWSAAGLAGGVGRQAGEEGKWVGRRQDDQERGKEREDGAVETAGEEGEGEFEEAGESEVVSKS